MTAIIWLASYPRSGNTWTRIFLHNLLDILEGRDAGSHDINDLGRRTTWEIAPHWFEGLLAKPLDECSRDEIAEVREKAQAKIAAETDGLLFVKTHNALLARHGIPVINLRVTAGAIYIVRNPLDVTVSFAKHFGLTIDDAITHMATTNLETPITEKGVYEVYGSWSQNVATWTAKAHRALYVMRYEDMLKDAASTFRALARHLLIAPTPEQLDKSIALSSFEAAQRQEEAKGFRERPEQSERFFRAGRAGAWQEALSEAQVRRIVAGHREQMTRFDYVPEGY